MKSRIERFKRYTDHFADQPRWDFHYSIDNFQYSGIEEFIVYSMGCMAVPFEILRIHFLERREPLRLEICREVAYLQNNSEQDPLFGFCSYSGNSPEVVMAYDLLPKNRSIMMITSGGRLAQIASDKRHSILRLQPGSWFEQEYVLWNLFGLINVLTKAFSYELGLISKDHFLELQEAFKVLKHSHIEEKAEVFAREIIGHIPLFLTTPKWMWALAYPIKIIFNEISLTPGYVGFFPEWYHNEMLCYRDSEVKFCFVLLEDPDDHVHMNFFENFRDIFTKEYSKNKNLKLCSIQLIGTNALEKIFQTFLFACHFTYYVARTYSLNSYNLFEKYLASLKKRVNIQRF